LKLLEGKKGIILGVANERSLAWGIAKEAHAQGATLGFNYLGEALERRVRDLAGPIGADFIEPMDVGEDTQVERFFDKVRERWNSIDFLVHSIAYARKDGLSGRFVDTTRADFLLSLDISCYSFIVAARSALPLINPGGSLLCLTYLGSQRAVPNYNVMGVSKAALEATTKYLAADLGKDGLRVNAISAGPIRTLSAAGISDFNKLLRRYSRGAALRRNVTQEDVGRSAVYLLSDLASGVSGEIHYVDAGFNIGIGDLELG